MQQRLHRIAAKLAIVPHLPGRGWSFGEEQHRFRLGPPLEEGEVSAFETHHGIRLPEDYRSFVTGLGHHGAGPHYGLLPLTHWDHAVRRQRLPDHLARPFPVLPGKRPGPDWWQGLETPDEPYTGAITLTSQGCAYATLLVVTGPARGRIVNIDLDRQPPYFSPDPDFLAWYERWLDETADGLDTHGFNTSIPGDEATLTAILRGDSDPGLRQRAAQTLGRRPAPVPAARVALRQAARADPDLAVRLAAVGALAKHPRDTDLRLLRDVLDDASPRVRAAALWSLQQRGGGWYSQARRALRDADSEVRQAAIRALDASGALGGDELLPMLADPSPPVRAQAIGLLPRLGSPHAEPAARRGLIDPDPGVRHASVSVLHRNGWLTITDRTTLQTDPDLGLRARGGRLRRGMDNRRRPAP